MEASSRATAIVDTTQTGHAPQIFISHARADARYAARIERALTVWGAQPWVDRQQLAGGQEWRQELQQAIDRSAALIVAVTPAALASDMVRREYLYALSQRKPVLLVRFKPVAHLPAELAGLPSVDYWGKAMLIGANFYLMLEDHGLLSPPTDQTVALAPADMFHLYANRIPPDWQVFQAPLRASQNRVTVFAAILLLLLLGVALAPPIIQATLGERYLWTAFLFPLVAILFLIFWRFFGIVMHLNIVLGRFPRDTIILAPDHVTAQCYTTEHRRLAMAPYRFTFHNVTDATVSQDRQGRAVVTLTYGPGSPPARIVIPRSIPQFPTIAARIAAQANAYRLAHPTLAPGDHALPQVNATPPMPVTTYCVIAATRDQPLLQEIQAWLARRGCLPEQMVAGPGSAGLILPTQAGAARSRFALILPSPTVTQTPQCQAIIADLRHQGKLVIPIRASGAATLPDQLAALQWIDFGPGIDRDRSFLDLCDTLDQAGALPTLPTGQFDAEVALARAIHERAPAGWYVVKPDTSADRLYRIRQIASFVVLLYPLGLAALFASAFTGQIQAIYATQDHASATFVAGGTILVLVALCAIPWLWSARLLRSFRLFGRLMSGYHAPPCVVITPTGIAFHVMNRNGTAFSDGGMAFAALRSVRVRYGFLGATTLRLTPKQGAPILVPLTYFGAFVDTLSERAQAGMRG